MPAVSEAQRRAMWAAAEGHSTLGIPQEVGKEFVGADSLGAAGIVHQHGNKVLLIQRSSDSKTYPSHWAFAGGHIEAGEDPKTAAIREVEEEISYKSHDPKYIGSYDSGDMQFHAFHEIADSAFKPVLNDESQSFGWYDADSLPEPMIPSCKEIISKLIQPSEEATEYKIMEDIRYGRLPSPQKYGNCYLFDIRVTGTGLAERSSGEIAHKSPAFYLTNEFLSRCNGLPVIMEHPDNKLLDSTSFKNQIIGTSSLPYVKGDDVWTIARIYDEDAAKLMSENQLSTSPAVTISKSAIKTGNLLEEGNPTFIDHIAVCSAGVWDKGAPDGVRIDSTEVTPMSEAVHAPTVGEEVLNKILERLDSLESKVDAKHDMSHNKLDSEEKEDCMKADESLSAEEKEEVKEECKEEIEGAHHVADSKEDADKADSAEEKMDSKEEDKADSKEEEETKEEEKEVKDDSRADSKILELEKQIAALQGKVAERSIEDREELARVQSRADSVAMALGDTSGIAPVMGESVFAFRKRLASRFAKFSSRFKDVDIGSIKDAALFAPVEEAVYADSLAYAKAPPVAEGTVHMVESRDDAGRMIRTPSANSDPKAWMDMFANGAKFRGNIRV